MTKKTLLTFIVLPLVFILAACSSLQIPGISNASANSGNNNQANAGQGRNGGFGGDPAKMPVDSKLGIGILKLEGTPQAVTAKQANDLLPLWKALKTMLASNTASADEITALLKQIQDTLTPDQVQAVQKLTWTQADLQAIMQQYGIQGAGGQGGFANLTPAERATRVAQFQAQGGGNRTGGTGGNNGTGGRPAGGGFPGGGGFGGGQGGTGNGQGTNTNVQRTPSPAQLARRAAGMNSIFVDPVIKLLQTRASS